MKLITAIVNKEDAKQVCNHPYHYLKHGDMSLSASGKTEKLMQILNTIVSNNEKTEIGTQVNKIYQ